MINRRDFLLSVGASLATPSLGAIEIPAEQTSHQPTRSNPPTKPNFIVMICDDLGYGDLGCYGSKIHTPNLDAMAREGMRFTHFNTPNPTCSASRACVLTGRYAQRCGVTRVFFPYDKGGMNLDESTIANVLKPRGYTSMCIGKWHLGQTPEYLPISRGFDHYFGVPYSVDMSPLPMIRDTTILEEHTDRNLLTQRYTKNAVEFIQSSKDKPFFLYLAYSYPHIPIHASDKFRGKSKQGIYGDAVQEIDWSVGEIRRTLREHGLEENTLVLFTSDHGPWYQGSPGMLRGRKDTSYEGGCRVPLIASWKGQIPEGKVSETWTSNLDILPTLAALSDAPLPEKPLDGLNISSLLSGKKDNIERDVMLYFSGDDWNVYCGRLDHWKLRFAEHDTPPYDLKPLQGRHTYRLAHPELYDLSDDPMESYDVAQANPQLVQQILERVDAKIPSFPPTVQQAYQAQQQLVGNPTTSPGARPRPINTKAPPWHKT